MYIFITVGNISTFHTVSGFGFQSIYFQLLILLQIPSGLPKSLQDAVQRYGSSTYKANAITVLDQNGKPTFNLTYGELLILIVVSRDRGYCFYSLYTHAHIPKTPPQNLCEEVR